MYMLSSCPNKWKYIKKSFAPATILNEVGDCAKTVLEGDLYLLQKGIKKGYQFDKDVVKKKYPNYTKEEVPE